MSRGPRVVQDPIGNKYKSLNELSKAWNIDYRLLIDRLNRGWDLWDAVLITKGQHRPSKTETFTIAELAALYGVDGLELKETLKSHINIADAVYCCRVRAQHEAQRNDFKLIEKLGAAKADKIINPHIDHTGTVYGSFNKMCKAWGKSPSTVKHRINTGWNIEEALEL